LDDLNPFDAVFINTDSAEVSRAAEKYEFGVIERPEYLSKDDANGNDLLLYDASKIDAEYYFQMFVTAPLLRPKTIYDCHNILINSEEVDSIFTVENDTTWYWQDGSPLNYNPKELPRSQDVEPIYKESTGLYGISSEALKITKCRIGNNPHLHVIDSVEAVDVDEKIDLDIARKLYDLQE
jgi:CMP-N-acetylneuraminic acid synthetase